MDDLKENYKITNKKPRVLPIKVVRFGY